MQRKISLLLIVATLALISTLGTAQARVWEPCGTKVTEGDVDAVYALSFNFPAAGPQFAFFDYNIKGGQEREFDDYDSAYLDMNGNGIIDPNIDIRLTPWHNVPATSSQYKYAANTMVGNDLDQGLPVVVPQNQQVIYFLDLENDGYDIDDPLYIDVNSVGAANAVVEVHDIRLTNCFGSYKAYTTVCISDADEGKTLRLLTDPNNNQPVTFASLLGYIDDDCSGTWTAGDKLYLQQPKSTGFDLNANFYVTIGDLRIYIPPAAIKNECWPSCGTKVKQGDIDAVYTLSNSGAWIGFFDCNNNGVFDYGDTAYVDMVSPGNGRVDNGDVRLTAWCDYPANTKVINDLDQGLPLTYPAQENLVKFFDINNEFWIPGYDLADPLYLDMDNNFHVSLYDIRLTPRTDYGYKAYSIVSSGAKDLNDPLPFWPVGGFDITPADLIGYIDSDCSGTWGYLDKLYLEQPVFNANAVLQADRLVTIGDMRLFIPPEAIKYENWPKCGTKVEQCDIDAVYALKTTPAVQNAALKFYDFNMDGFFNDKDTLYIDINGNTNNVIECGDVRLTPWHNVPEASSDFKYPANTVVCKCDLDLNKRLIPVGATIMYFDINGNGFFDLKDPVYIDIPNANTVANQVTLFDVRLTPTLGYDAYTTVKAGDKDLIEKRVLTPIDDGTGQFNGVLNTLLGYLDVDCSDTWTYGDKLYLQQPQAVPSLGNDVVTIGDLRLYIPPEEIQPPSIKLKGDINGDGAVNMGDVIRLMNFVTSGKSEFTPVCSGDINGDKAVNMGDVIRLMNFVTSGKAEFAPV